MKQAILDAIDKSITDFFYYDRKENDDIGLTGIQDAINSGQITKQEIIDEFTKLINKELH